MSTIYFDCFAGASGDMIVGTLIDLGLDINFLREELAKIPISMYEMKVDKTTKNSISATRFEVYLTGSEKKRLADDEYSELPEDLESPNFEEIDHSGHAHRSFKQISTLITKSLLSDEIKSRILSIFRNLAEAEASAHGVPFENVHLHEVGAIDAIIDIASAVIGFHKLDIAEIIVSPLPLGSGFIHSSHGTIPIPAPATVYLLTGFPVYNTEFKGEFVTPTGAAILTTLASNSGTMPPMIIKKIGHGAGKRDREFPNILRGFLGTRTNISGNYANPQSKNRDPYPQQHEQPITAEGYQENAAIVLEANIDDMNPQLYGNLMDKLLAAGALDVTFTPTIMKKNRPGIILQVLSPLESSLAIENVIFLESCTIGIRSYPVTKHMLHREILALNTVFGEAKVKISKLKGKITNISPEYESCLILSQQTGIPVKEIYSRVLGEAQSLFDVGK